jgi:hypothetical protein
MPRASVPYPNRSSLRTHLLWGLYLAAGFSVLALIIVSLAAIQALVRHQPLPPGGSGEIVAGIGTVILAYFVGGIGGATVVWALRPLRRWVLGWILTGILVATVAYGSVGLLGTLLYVNAGINIFDFDSPAQAWTALPAVTIAIGLLAGIPGGLFFWWKRPWG